MSDTEEVSVTVTRYRIPTGAPTCAIDTAYKRCSFLRTSNFGQMDVCVLGPRGLPLNRRGADGLGFLIPGSYCCVWPQNEIVE